MQSKKKFLQSLWHLTQKSHHTGPSDINAKGLQVSLPSIYYTIYYNSLYNDRYCPR